ncbi:hypothetical protein PMZ80_003151 [Knufia obscura]|uniref:Uncharacterized protein n=2 Tax=Knufia TaxID=430999 RepID=A0AAN8I2T5_9EURO|nr:hypothetical protein PMZ80_003151 [Knufia obscura]KAK5949309.1 hypothetical protein OHC33_009662 [Knufia fluminis]
MTSFSRFRARLGRRNRDTEKVKTTKKAKISWLCPTFGASRTSAGASSPDQSGEHSSISGPTSRVEQACQAQRHISVCSHEGFDLVTLEKAWFTRRTSSLHRQSAYQTPFKEEVRSPRPARCYEYVPLAFDFSSEGIEVEMKSLSGREDVTEIDLTDFWNLVEEIQPADKGKQPDDRQEINSAPVSNYTSFKVVAELDLDGTSNSGIEQGFPSPQYHPKHRPAPIDISRARPTSYIEHQCNVSNTPFTLPGQWPASAKSTARPQTAATADSGLILDWW